MFQKHESQQRHFQGKNSKYYAASVVYTIDDHAEMPMVINASVMESTFNAMLNSRAMENAIEIKALERMNPHVRLERLRKRLIGADKKPITVRGTTHVPARIIKKKTKLRCVAVENLSMKLIIGFPGLRDLGLSTDLKHISEME